MITDGPLLLRAGVNAGFLNQATSRHVYSAGTRYEIHKNYALKAEVSRINLDNSSANPNNFPVVPAVGAGVVVSRPQNFNLFSVVLDFVF